MVAPECKPPVGIRNRDIMKFISRTNRLLIRNSHSSSTSGECSQLEGREAKFTWNSGSSLELEIGGEGAERGGCDVISREKIGLYRRHRRRRLREGCGVTSPTNALFYIFLVE